jgi:hypothetical protein
MYLGRSTGFSASCCSIFKTRSLMVLAKNIANTANAVFIATIISKAVTVSDTVIMDIILATGEKFAVRRSMLEERKHTFLLDYMEVQPGQPFQIQHPLVTRESLRYFLGTHKKPQCILLTPFFISLLWTAEVLCYEDVDWTHQFKAIAQYTLNASTLKNPHPFEFNQARLNLWFQNGDELDFNARKYKRKTVGRRPQVVRFFQFPWFPNAVRVELDKYVRNFLWKLVLDLPMLGRRYDRIWTWTSSFSNFEETYVHLDLKYVGKTEWTKTLKSFCIRVEDYVRRPMYVKKLDRLMKVPAVYISTNCGCTADHFGRCTNYEKMFDGWVVEGEPMYFIRSRLYSPPEESDYRLPDACVEYFQGVWFK